MRFEAGDWVLGCACAKCRRRNAILKDGAQGEGPMRAPFQGRFSYRCDHCGADNRVVAEDLTRFQWAPGGTRRPDRYAV